MGLEYQGMMHRAPTHPDFSWRVLCLLGVLRFRLLVVARYKIGDGAVGAAGWVLGGVA